MAAQDPQPGSPARYEAADKMLKVCSVAQRHSAARKQRIAPGSPNCLCVSFPFPPVLVPCPKHEAPNVSDPCHTYRGTRLVPHSSGTGREGGCLQWLSPVQSACLKASM